MNYAIFFSQLCSYILLFCRLSLLSPENAQLKSELETLRDRLTQLECINCTTETKETEVRILCYFDSIILLSFRLLSASLGIFFILFSVTVTCR